MSATDLLLGGASRAAKLKSAVPVRMRHMGGEDTLRGVGYQNAHALLAALEVLDDPRLAALRIEGADDVVDIELLAPGGITAGAKQIKTRRDRTWGQVELLNVLRAWAELPSATHSTFKFVTDGRLGPTGQRLVAALSRAGEGDTRTLAELLDENPDSPICVTLGRASVLIDDATAAALRERARLQVRALLVGTPTEADADEESRRAISVLDELLLERGGRATPEERVVTRYEIAGALGVPADQKPEHRWSDAIRPKYLEGCARVETFEVQAELIRDPMPGSSVGRPDAATIRALAVVALLDEQVPALLTGRTGSGKSTAVESLRRAPGRVVLLARAETYMAGRIAALASDAIADVLGAPVPCVTGRQALADSDVTFVVDGVSEIPPSLRDALAQDLRQAAAGRGCRLILVGRDLASLRTALPTTVNPATFSMFPLGPSAQVEIARRVLGLPHSDGRRRVDEAHVAVKRIGELLGDAASNPLLLTMALEALVDGGPLTDRPSLYREFIGRLAARTGAEGMGRVVAVLGVVFARLLDRGRRYADAVDWDLEVAAAVDTLTARGIPASAQDTEVAATRSGLVLSLGFTQTRAAMHDSFADYLAGHAHATGLAPYPTRLDDHDQERIAFAAEEAGLDQGLAELVAQGEPFWLVRLAPFDRRPIVENDDTPDQVAELIRLVARGTLAELSGVRISAVGSGRLRVWLETGGRPGWQAWDRSQGLLGSSPAVIVDANIGPVTIAVRLWRDLLTHQLALSRSAVAVLRPLDTVDDACAALADHTREKAHSTTQLISRLAPPGHEATLSRGVGQLGLKAVVSPSADSGSRWGVAYWPSDEVAIAPSGGSERSGSHSVGVSTSSVEYLIREAPEVAARQVVRAAFNRLTKPQWL